MPSQPFAESDLLPVGRTIPMGGKWVYIVKRIGEGYTSVVYEGRLLLQEDDFPEHCEKVAVKAFKPYMDVESFRQEDRTLWDLTRLEPVAAEDMFLDKSELPRLGIELHVSPRYYGSSKFTILGERETEVPFIVMEFVTGNEISDMVDCNGKLPEKDAVMVMWEFFFILDILHTRLKKTLMDMKFENIWWQEIDGLGRARVMDLGTLSDLKPTARYFGNSHLDLMRAGIIFFRMLTGHGLAYSVDGLKEAVEPLLKQYPMSWGTRQIVRRCLHWKEDERYKEAIEVFAELAKMHSYWKQDNDQLLAAVLEKINQADEARSHAQVDKDGDREEQQFAYQARAMLGVIEARSDRLDEDTQHALRQVEEFLSIEDYLRTGQKLLQGGSYHKAAKHFEKGMYSGEQPAVLRRWFYAASAAVELRADTYIPISLNLHRALDRINRDEFVEAAQELKYLPDVVRASTWIQALATDCAMYIEFQKAQKAEYSGQYQDAKVAYEAAQAQLVLLPNLEDVTVQELGDLKVRVLDMMHLEVTRGEATRMLSEVDQKKREQNYAAVLAIFHKVREIDPHNKDLSSHVIHAIDAAIKESHFIDAERLVAFGLQQPGYGEEMVVRKTIVHGLSKAVWYQQLDETDLFVQKACQLLHQFPSHEAIEVVLNKLTGDYENLLREAKQPEKLRRLNDVIKVLPGSNQAWTNRINEAAGKLEESSGAPQRKEVDELISDSKCMLAFAEDGYALGRGEKMRLGELIMNLHQQKQGMIKAQEWLKKAAQIATPISYRLSTINNLQRRVDQKLVKVEAKTSGGAEAQERARLVALADVTQRWNEVQVADKFAQQIPDWFSEQTKKEIEDSKTTAVHLAFVASYAYRLRFGEGDETVNKIYKGACQILDRRGIIDWKALAGFVDTHIGEIQHELDEVKQLFEQGKLDYAVAKAERLNEIYGASQELIELKENIYQVEVFETWQRDKSEALKMGKYDQSLLEEIGAHLVRCLPAAYWKESLACRYLLELEKNTKMDIGREEPASRHVAELVAILGKVKNLQNKMPK